MARQRITSGSTFEHDFAYARAVVEGDWVFVAGTTGFDYTAMTIADGIVAQCDQALRNIADALEAVGCTMANVVRVRYLVAQGQDFSLCAGVLRENFGAAPPAATMMIVGLLDPRMLIEIEVTARLPQV